MPTIKETIVDSTSTTPRTDLTMTAISLCAPDQNRILAACRLALSMMEYDLRIASADAQRREDAERRSWVDKPPETEGYYWIIGATLHPLDLVHVYRRLDDVLAIAYLGSEIELTVEACVRLGGIRWLGPIAPPVRP